MFIRQWPHWFPAGVMGWRSTSAAVEGVRAASRLCQRRNSWLEKTGNSALQIGVEKLRATLEWNHRDERIRHKGGFAKSRRVWGDSFG